MKEFAHAFGEKKNLIGVVSQPDPAQRRRGAPALIVANVGVNHRVGPVRLYVYLTRALAARGYTCLRFDLSGLGDSEQAGSTLADGERWVEDSRAAMKLLEEHYGAKGFVLLGLCSGVDTVHSTTLADPRVLGATFVDGYAYPTPWFHVRRLARRAVDVPAWKLFLSRWLPRLFRGPLETPWLKDAPEVFVRPVVLREQFISDLAKMLERGVRLLYVYTGGFKRRYSYSDQFHHMVRPLETRGKVDVEIHPRADHLFSVERDRNHLIHRVSDWMLERFPGEAG